MASQGEKSVFFRDVPLARLSVFHAHTGSNDWILHVKKKVGRWAGENMIKIQCIHE